MIEELVQRAVAGDRDALEGVVREIQDDIYHLCMRMLGGKAEAEDATQEVLVQVITHLAQWRGEATLRTWVWRIATRHVLRMKRGAVEEVTNWEAMEEAVHAGDGNPPMPALNAGELAVLEEELRLACTEGMLLSLDRDHRVAWILAEVFELGADAAAEVLEVEPAAFRKRLQRARERLGTWMDKHCGIVNALNACNCRRQVPVGLAIGAIDPKALQFADHPERAPSRRIKLAMLTEAADSVERARATLCNCPDYAAPPSIGARLRALIDSGTVRLLANSILVLCVAGLAACGAAAPRQVADTSQAATSQVADTATPQVAASQVADTADVAAHRRAYALFSAHDEAMFTLFADDIVEHQGTGPAIEGKAALIQLNRAFWSGFSDLRVDVEHVYQQGSYTVLVGRLRGTNDGDMPILGVSHTGRTIDVPFTEVVLWRDGKAIASWPFMDEAALAAQLGAGG